MKSSMHEGSWITKLIVSTALCLGAAAAQANLVLYDGLEGGSGDVDNVLFGDEVAPMVGGVSTLDTPLNTSGGVDVVRFTSTTDVLESEAEGNGQCCLNSLDGNLNEVTIGLIDPTLGFAKLQFNLQAPGADEVDVDISMIDQFGTVFGAFTRTLGNGENFFTVLAEDDQVMVSLTIVGAQGFSMRDLQQVRVGSTDVDVPEPATLALLGIGLLGIGVARRRRVA